ncbi:MAG: hypothetical protein ABFD06_12585, partial [Smithella sp.]
VDDWVGCHILSKKIVRNGLGELPAGTIFIITSSGITKHFQSLPCKCCGFKLMATSRNKKEVFLSDFDFVEIIK